MEEAKLMIGHKVRAIREIQEISQEYLAKQIGISQTSMSLIENGQMPLSFDKVCEIAGILNVDVNTIINYDKSVIFNTCTQSGYINTNYINSTEKMEALYDKLLSEKDERIKLLEAQINGM